MKSNKHRCQFILQEAAEKLQRAEKERHIMEEKVKLWKTPVGLARPILPHPEPMTTHRGKGAFCDHDFQKTRSDFEKVKASIINEPVTAPKPNDINNKSETHISIAVHGDASLNVKSADADGKLNAESENCMSDHPEEKDIKTGEESLIKLETEDTGIRTDLQSDKTEKHDPNCVPVDINLDISNAEQNYREETNDDPETDVVNTCIEPADKQNAISDIKTHNMVDNGEDEIIKSETNYENILNSENQHEVSILELS